MPAAQLKSVSPVIRPGNLCCRFYVMFACRGGVGEFGCVMVAGGVTVSFFEWVQNLQNFRWEEEEVNKRLDRAMTEAFAQIWEISRQKKLPLRTAAFVKALQSVTRAHLHSAFWPSPYQLEHICWSWNVFQNTLDPFLTPNDDSSVFVQTCRAPQVGVLPAGGFD